MDANVDSIENLRRNLSDNGYDPLTIPYALQLNKRDLPTAVPADEMQKQLRFRDEPAFEAVATTGKGVFETLKGIIKLVLLDLKRR